MPYSPCSRCEGIDTLPPPISSTGISKYKAGFICAVNESLGRPFESVLQESPGIDRYPLVHQECATNIKRFTDLRVGKCRPCIVLKSRNVIKRDGVYTPQMNTFVCLMGTFNNGKTPYERLPRICRHFVIPVRPNPLSGPDGFHIHVSPEMSNASQYIIAIQVNTERFIEGIWPLGDPGASSPPIVRHVDHRSMLELQTIMTERMAEWNRMCEADHEFAINCAIEYRVRQGFTGACLPTQNIDLACP